MQIADVKLVANKGAKSIIYVGFTFADRFYLGTQQLYTGGVFIQYLVLKIGFLILYVDFILTHRCKLRDF